MKEAAPPPKTAAKDQDVIMIIDSDDEPDQPPPSKLAPVEYEDEEDEADPDAPYPSIIQDIDLNLGSPVLHIAIPSIPSQASQRPSAANDTAFIAVYTADGHISALRIPLAPPAGSSDAARNIIDKAFLAKSGNAPVQDLSAKFYRHVSGNSTHSSGSQDEFIVAAASSSLLLWRLPLQFEGFRPHQNTQQKVVLATSSTHVAFHPSARSTQLLLADRSGSSRVYDMSPLLETPLKKLKGPVATLLPQDVGRWLMVYQAPLHAITQGQTVSPSSKRLLDAKWVLGGRAILALLEDGEWGVWDVNVSAQSSQNVETFALRGFLGSATAGEPAQASKPKKGSSTLAPMTPNTRKAKSETLFTGAPRVQGAVSRGGISVTSSDNLSGQADESVMLWYNSEIYAIPNMQQFWQRSTNNAGNGAGSLYTPGLSHILDINLMNENITSISQFGASTNSSGLGQMNTARDFLLSAEHRFIIQQTTRPQVSARGLFQQAAAAAAPAERDQRMLNSGELDLDGMDRMLDTMANGDARPRRVGFAR